ncbi:hypothetical protein [Deinococcus yavapaiensis]|uniref:Uncharacterized protein n=1 Tax=Deinococcus yavapaiensis KR-236 TaxID=694435 RepID=A0A318SFV9_9DEIO|nr:hypothetical protein [Deinococcus yavapaiensis]PYE56647.1 hypothetical protein DES52_101452 [Deinococcus yavapaiensis KR-236]
MEVEMFNTLLGPLLFAMIAGIYGYTARPDKREPLLLALTALLVMSGAISYLYPSTDLFILVMSYAMLVCALLTLNFRRPVASLQ